MSHFGTPAYGLTTRLPATTLDAARPRVQAALASEGFGVLTEIDVRATMKKKLDVEVDPYLILGACNPQLAHQALTAQPGIGLLLPCNVVLAQQGEDVVVSTIDPVAQFGIVGDPAVQPLAAEVKARLERVLHAL